jgi:GMP synthase-like glutamine amidotransferase
MNLVIFHRCQNIWKAFKPNNRLPLIQDTFCINNIISASLAILKAQGISADIDGKFLFNDQARSILKHVSFFSFYLNSNLYVPFHLNNCQDFEVPSKDEEILTERWKNSENFQFEPFKIFDLYPDPDFLLFNCLDSPPTPEVSEALFTGFFIKGTEKWNHYFVPQGQFPDIQAMRSAKGILITGSRHCSYDLSQDWKLQLFEVLRQFSRLDKKIVGICFGHQAIAKAFGGETCRNPSDEYFYGPEVIEGNERFRIMESHGDCVSVLPEFFRKIARSESCEVEGMEFDGKILSFQGHPEYTLEFVKKFHLIKHQRIISEERFQEILNLPEDSFDSFRVLEEINKYLRDQENIFTSK